jgi:GNAT superfamily N-acetyltransferase
MSHESVGGATPAQSLTVTDDLTPEQLAFLEDRLYEFNVGATGIGDGRWLGVLARDERGDVVAGLSGTTWGGCCKVRDVWVREDLRRRGMGTRLLDAAEAEARRRGCTQVLLSSHSFQAPDFYRKRGFEVIAVVDDDPIGHREVFLRKRLEG